MLLRAAGRRQRRHTSRQLAASFDQLRLPFLCPAQLQWNAARAASSSSPRPHPHDAKEPQRLHQSHSRHLGTIAEAQSTSHSSNGSIPHSLSGSDERGSFGFHTRDYDQKPLMIPLPVHVEEKHRSYTSGVGGGLQEMVQGLFTCLKVQRYHRAEAIIRRLSAELHPLSGEIAHAHGLYLAGKVDQLLSEPDRAERSRMMNHLQSWFDNEIWNKGVPPDSKILVAMIRAALNSLTGIKRDEAVRHYTEIAEVRGTDTYEGVLYATAYTDDEFTTLGQISSRFYVSPNPKPAIDPRIEVAESADADGAADSSDKLPSSMEDKFAEIVEVNQSGLGLTSLKETLRAFDELANKLKAETPSDSAISDTGLQHALAMQRQLLVEESASEVAAKRWKAEDEQLRRIGINTSMKSKPVGALMWDWYSALLPLLQKEFKETKQIIDRLEKQEHLPYTDERLLYAPYLELMTPESAAVTTIITVMTMFSRVKRVEHGEINVGPAEHKLAQLTAEIGRTMQLESQAQASKREARKSAVSKPSNGKLRGARLKPERRRSLYWATTGIPHEDVEEWPINIRVAIGAMLVSKLIQAANISITRQHPRTKEMVTAMVPAFMHKFTYSKGKRIGCLQAHPELIQRLLREPVGGLLAKRLPMVVEPVPWTGFRKGAYLNYPTDFIRYPSSDPTPKQYAYAAIEKGDMDQVFQALNVLGKVPWHINRDVLRVQIEAWNMGEKIANFPPADPSLPVPPEPETTDASVRRQWLMDVKDVQNLAAGLHSQRCFQNFQLEVARTFSEERLYFPHNIDFRGRAYPLPPYLNHMGADNVRSIVQFADGKELGEAGLRWLKIHLANVFGFDKASLQERADFTMEHIDDVYDSATNPLGGRRWWLQSEDAWQTLAACFELKKALDSPDPTKYVSHLPIHQDGTCNGLQHYAALGGDEVGAAQVNLQPGDRPADVYTAVANAVSAEIDKDAAAGNPVAQMLQGKISRKIVKRPVMTNVYGVTWYGAKEQISGEFHELFPHIKRSDPINQDLMAKYVAHKIFGCLGTMFKGAVSIQKWLGECAERIAMCVTGEQIIELQNMQRRYKMRMPSKEEREKEKEKALKRKGAKTGPKSMFDIEVKELFKSSIIWTTPLRLPVVQPYRVQKGTAVYSTLQSNIHIMEPRPWDPVAKRKQLQGFAPNFIHSLDATHMMLSAIKCDEIGMTFASIHDSFWTHACDVNELSIVLRDAFVSMHSDDIIARLREEFETRYKNGMYLASVSGKTEVGKRIHALQKKLRYDAKISGVKKSKGMSAEVMELLIEKERVDLLNSDDPADQEAGRAMVTPGSIFAAEADESALTDSGDLSGTRLGEVPDSVEESTEQDKDAEDLLDPILGEDHEAIDEEGASVSEVSEDPEEMEAAEAEPTEESVEEEKSENMGKKPKRAQQLKRVQFWLPVTFPAVPAKGSFDVKTLKDSVYFFS